MVKNTRLKAYFVLALVLVLGAVAGGAATFAYVHHKHAKLLGEGGPWGEGRRLRMLSRKLDLNDGQQEKLRAILAKDRETSRDLGRDMFEKCGQSLREHKAQVDAEVRAVLSPEQQKRYDQLLEERRGRGFIFPLR